MQLTNSLSFSRGRTDRETCEMTKFLFQMRLKSGVLRIISQLNVSAGSENMLSPMCVIYTRKLTEVFFISVSAHSLSAMMKHARIESCAKD